MNIKRKLLYCASGIFKKIITMCSGRNASFVLAHCTEQLAPCVSQKTPFGPITFFCPGELSLWRAQTLLTKEPETLEWINSFQDGEVLWDIGANIGLYSLYAAAKGHTVVAFEPSPSNYYLLSRNSEVNRLDKKIAAYCIAFSDRTALDTFFMANTECGGALNSFGQSIDWQGQEFTPTLSQAMLGFTVDDFIKYFNPPFPQHIKVDVDGIEDKIVKGAQATLADKRLRSVSIELDTEKEEYSKKVRDSFERAGFKFLKKEHAQRFEKSTFAKVFNHIFIRPE
jgi:FkbM family methyltransferase